MYRNALRVIFVLYLLLLAIFVPVVSSGYSELKQVSIAGSCTEMAEHYGSAARPLSTCEPFPWSRPTTTARKTVFNLVAADNQFEKTFAEFLQKASDVDRFAKLPERFGFTVAYTDSAANLRYYEPDFVAVTADGIYHLIETKGREDVDVAHKDRAARLWC